MIYIRMYDSTFYVGMSWVENGYLYLSPHTFEVWEQLCDNHSKVGHNTYSQNTFAILLLKMCQKFCYPTQKLRKTNMKISILLSFFPLLLFHHVWLKNHRAHMNVLHVKQMVYCRKRDFSRLELYASHNWWVTTQNTHHSRLPRGHFVCTFGHTLWSIGRILTFYIPNNFSAVADIPFQL